MIEPLAIYFSLVLARVSLFVAVLPVLGGQYTPRMVKLGLVVSLSILFAMTFLEGVGSDAILNQARDVSWFHWSLALGREAMLGVLFGFGFSLFLVPGRIAAEFISQEIGLSFANQVTPSASEAVGPLTAIFDLLATLLYLGLDLHHLCLSILHGTFERFPVGASFPLPVCDVIGQASSAQESGLMLAAPVVGAMFLTTIILALMTRAAPQLNLYTVGFPLRMVVGLFALFVFLPQLIAGFVSVFGHCTEMLQQMG